MVTLNTQEGKTREWKWKTGEESARAEITGVENAGGDCSKYGQPIVFWLDKITVTLFHRWFIPLVSSV